MAAILKLGLWTTSGQIFLMTPATFPVWLAGAFYFLFGREGRRLRVLGWTFLTVLATLIVLHGKDYYSTPVYPMVFAAGAVAMEELAGRPKQAWVKPVLVALILVITVLMLPIAVPVLSVERYLRYQSKLPFALPASERGHLRGRLPHHYAWDFGWEEMTTAVARVYHSLPPEERAKTAIFGNNFGEAGARLICLAQSTDYRRRSEIIRVIGSGDLGITRARSSSFWAIVPKGRASGSAR